MMSGDLVLKNRRNGAKLRDSGGYSVKSEINFRFGGVAAETEPEAGLGLRARETDGSEHVRRLDRAGRAGGASGTSQSFEVESDDERFAFDAGKLNIGSVRRALRFRGVDARLRNTIEHTAFETIAKSGDARGVGSERMTRKLGGFSESNDAGDIFRARAEAALMMSAVNERIEARAGADIERANTFGSVEFVAGNREEIHAERIDIHGNFSGGLDRVGVKNNFVFAGDAGDFRDRLDRTEFVIGVHDGNQNGFGANGAANIFRVNDAVLACGEIGDGDAALLEMLARAVNRFVLDAGGDDMRRLSGSRRSTGSGIGRREGVGNRAEDGVVVRLSAAGGEDNLLGLGAEQGSDLPASGLDRGACTLAGSVNGRGVGKVRGETGKHGVEDSRIDGRCSVMVKVDASHGRYSG